MPFVVMCGCPSSGKTTRALQLKTYLNSNTKLEVQIISDGDFGIDKNDVYAGKCWRAVGHRKAAFKKVSPDTNSMSQ